MKRRQFLSAAAVSPVALLPATAPGPEPAWIVVAHRGWNMNQREYTDRALQSMADGLKGLMVVSMQLDVLPISLEYCHGCVTAARFEHGQVQVQIRWFKGMQLRNGFLTPTGSGTKYENLKDGYVRVTAYTPWCLYFERGEAGFQGATRL